jgi:hypothetical protein
MFKSEGSWFRDWFVEIKALPFEELFLMCIVKWDVAF